MKGLVISTLIACAMSLSWRNEVTTRDVNLLDLNMEFDDWSVEFGKEYPSFDERIKRYGKF